MDKMEIVEKALDNLGVSKAAHEAYKDVLQPACREIGQNLLTVTKVITIALAPVRGSVWGFEKMADWLSVKLTERLAREDPTTIEAPPLHIAGPLLVNLRFAENVKELREMYANLLASAMIPNSPNRPHPSFTQVISQLSSEEARIVSWVAAHVPSVTVLTEVTDESGRPMDRAGWLEEQFQEIGSTVGVESTAMNEHLDNLVRLRILAVNEFTDTSYRPSSYFDEDEARLETTRTRELYVTDYGKKFIACCV